MSQMRRSLRLQQSKTSTVNKMNEWIKTMKEKKNANESPELRDEDLEQVAGGLDPSAPTKVYIDAIATAEATCKRCGHSFTYKYYWQGGMHDGPWNHPVPDFCPNCDPNAEHER